ncbi:MAG: Putative serine protein kinase, PrkA [Clostridia bacterium 41_269]|nr:MAG: Putative serine protein kinase, PrkA [Clostridia bacterium 41_269]
MQKIKSHNKWEEELKWEGTFRDYLKLVEKDPRIARSAHARVFDMIMEAGVLKSGKEKKYKFFAGEIFGLENTLKKIVDEYLRPASCHLDTKRRVLILVGPVGSGKSTIVNMLKKGLEGYTKTPQGALYSIKGCPMQEEPLHLMPQNLRQEFEKLYGVKVEGELCPFCRLMVKEVYGDRIEDVLVERIFISEQDRVGIGTFSPSDPKSQDMAELVGSMDFSTVGQYGSESDPRAYRFDGELNKANRGIMEFQEIFKADEKFLYILLNLAQEGCFKAGRYALISADELVVGHTNEGEFKKFIEEEKNEALKSRLFVVPVPYNLKVSQEKKIYQKLISQSLWRRGGDKHMAPHTLTAAAYFSVLTRLKETNRAGINLVKKMKLYDGELNGGYTSLDVEELKREFPREGFEGIDPRFVVDRLSYALVSAEKKCINVLDIFASLKEGIAQHMTLSAEEVEKYSKLLDLARREFEVQLEKDIRSMVLSINSKRVEEEIQKYLKNVELFFEQKKETASSDEKGEADEEFMGLIERELGILSEQAKLIFREEIHARLSIYAQKGKKFNLKSHKGIREAVEKKVFWEEIYELKSEDENPNVKQRLLECMISSLGYCPICAEELLDYWLKLWI